VASFVCFYQSSQFRYGTEESKCRLLKILQIFFFCLAATLAQRRGGGYGYRPAENQMGAVNGKRGSRPFGWEPGREVRIINVTGLEQD